MAPAVCHLLPLHSTSRRLGTPQLSKAGRSGDVHVAWTDRSNITTVRQLCNRNIRRRFRRSSTIDPLGSADEELRSLEVQQILSNDALAEQQDLIILQQHSAQQQLPPDCPAPQQRPYAAQLHHLNPLKYAQLGHSRFSRGAPHVCYWHLGNRGVFYVKPEWDELVEDVKKWLREQQQLQLQQQDGQAGLGHQHMTGIISNTSSHSGQGQQQQVGLLGWMQSSSALSALAAATAAAAALAETAARAAAGCLDKIVLQRREWSWQLLRTLSVAAVTCVLYVAAAELGRRLVALMILCYSGVLLT